MRMRVFANVIAVICTVLPAGSSFADPPRQDYTLPSDSDRENHLRFNPHKDAMGKTDKKIKPAETTVCDVLRTMMERLGVPARGFGDSHRLVNELLS